MTGSNEKDAAVPHNGSERRTRPHLRDIFEQAYIVAYPVLDSAQESHTGGPAHFLRVVLHDAFPDLHLQDVAILCVSIERVYRERSKTESH
jgi:hypothetical protein